MSEQETIFVSWSGDKSKAIAEVLKEYLEACFQKVEVFFSKDIPSGRKFLDEIGQTLEAAVAAVVVVTPDNANSQWLNFEAGAIGNAKGPGGKNKKVICLLVGYKSEGDYAGPLSQFQNVLLDDAGMSDLIVSLAADVGVDTTRFASLFKNEWESRKTAFEELRDQTSHSGKTRRSDREYLEEILTLTRHMAQDRNDSAHGNRKRIPGTVVQIKDDYMLVQGEKGGLRRIKVEPGTEFRTRRSSESHEYLSSDDFEGKAFDIESTSLPPRRKSLFDPDQ